MFKLLKRLIAGRQSADTPTLQQSSIVSQHLEALDRQLRGNENGFSLLKDFFKRFDKLNLGERSPSERLEWYEVRKELTKEKVSIPVRGFMMQRSGEEVRILLRLPRNPPGQHLDEFLIKTPENVQTLDQIIIGALHNGECLGEASLLEYVNGETAIFDRLIGPFRGIEGVSVAGKPANFDSLTQGRVTDLSL